MLHKNTNRLTIKCCTKKQIVSINNVAQKNKSFHQETMHKKTNCPEEQGCTKK